MSASEDLVIVDSTDYAQVVFDDVKECFSYDKPLTCVFTLNSLLRADKSDWIGIYKVGFTNCNEHLCIVPVSVDMIKDGKGKFTFQAEMLPKDDGEFYQFVYVSQGKQIRGASVPFQFKGNVSCEFIEEDEQDAVVVKYEINDPISEIKSRCAQLTKANETYENLVKENEQLIKSLREEVAAIKLRCFRLTMDNEKLNFTLRNKTDNLKNFADTITNLTTENNQLQSKFYDLSNENKNLVDSLQQRINQVDQLKNDLESVKLDQIVCLEKQVNDRVDELDRIRNDLRKNETTVAEQAQTIQSILSERDTLNGLIQKLTKEKNQLEASHENLTQELNFSKDKLSAAQQSKEILKSQFTIVTDELEDAKKKQATDSITINELKEKLAQSDAEKSQLIEKINQMKMEQEEANGYHNALRLAHTHLEYRLKSSEQRRDLTERENEIHKQTIEGLEKDNEDLRERIKQGAKEYTKLFEKNRLLRNQKFNSELSQDIDSSNASCRSRLTRKHHNSSLSDHGHESDSAIQEKTSHSNRGSATDDIENTFLDALLGSSFYNGDWNMNANKRLEKLSRNLLNDSQMSHLISNQQTIIPATITQPKSQLSQSCDLSDDGLNSKNAGLNNEATSSKICVTSQINSLPIVSNKQNNFPERFARNDLIINKNKQVCEICDYIFATDESLEAIEKHYSNHYGPTCPVCFLQFRKGYSQNDLESHVNSHFSS